MRTLHDNKITQALLKKLLEYGAKAIKKRSIQNENDLPDQTLESKIIEIFSGLMEEDYDDNKFRKQIIEKKLPPKPSAKKVIQLLYNFIYAVGVEGKKIDVNQVNAMSNEITEMIDKLNKRSRFFSFKEHFKKKILELTKIKITCSSVSTESETKELANDINNDISVFTKNDTLDIKRAIKILETFNKIILSNVSTPSVDYSLLETFFKSMCKKCQDFIEKKEYTKNSEKVNIGIRNIISEIKILASQLDSDSSIPSLNECLDFCKKLRYLSKSDKQKFSYNEKARKNKAFSLESFKKIVSLNQDAINKANMILEKNNFKEKIPDTILSKYNKIISDRNDDDILEEKFYSQNTKNMKSDVKKAMEKAASKSIFGKSIPTSNKILDKIVKLFS